MMCSLRACVSTTPIGRSPAVRILLGLAAGVATGLSAGRKLLCTVLQPTGWGVLAGAPKPAISSGRAAQRIR